MTFKEVREALRRAGMDAKHTGIDREMRVNFANGKEATAYFTDDLQDLLDTGLDMAARRDAALLRGRADPSPCPFPGRVFP